FASRSTVVATAAGWPPATRASEQCRPVKGGDPELGPGRFDPAGDVFGGHDYATDGRRVVTSWQTDYGRSGQCHAPPARSPPAPWRDPCRRAHGAPSSFVAAGSDR